jgi:hypothetical protein
MAARYHARPSDNPAQQQYVRHGDYQYGGGFGAWVANATHLQRTGALTAAGSRAVVQPEAVAVAREKQLLREISFDI